MYDYGIIARVAAPDQLEEAVQKIIQRLAANAPLSLRIMKKTLVRQMAFWHDQPHDDINAEVSKVSASNDAREGIEARLARRAANFTGT